MGMNHMEHYTRLTAIIGGYKSAIVAFSGGVDSTFLLKTVQNLLGDRVLALTILTPYIARWEVDEALEFTKGHKIRHEVMELPVIDSIRNNPINRCYLCKRSLFSSILERAKKDGFETVFDGSNADDPMEHRPGMKALEELGIVSPLMQSGLSKSEIRTLSREMDLPTWDKPPYACLLTRLPHDTQVNNLELRRIERSEKFLMAEGFKAIRVRSHGNVARIETDPGSIERISQAEIRGRITRELKKIGYNYITIDLEGYRTGSFNPNNNG